MVFNRTEPPRVGRVIEAPDWLKKQMEALRSLSYPSLSDVQKQMEASAHFIRVNFPHDLEPDFNYNPIPGWRS